MTVIKLKKGNPYILTYHSKKWSALFSVEKEYLEQKEFQKAMDLEKNHM